MFSRVEGKFELVKGAYGLDCLLSFYSLKKLLVNLGYCTLPAGGILYLQLQILRNF